MDAPTKDFLTKEDYDEPCCPLKMGETGNVNPISVSRVIFKLDEFLNKNDYESAERLLKYWLDEARAGNDSAGMLSVLNEQVGLYRKLGNKDACFDAVNACLELCNKENYSNTISYATTLLNCATGYCAFNELDKALPLYEAARKIYEEKLAENDERLGGLYNNTAICLMRLKKYDEALELFEKALGIMGTIPDRQGEMAVTYCNLADLEAQKNGMENSDEKIGEYLDKAESLLNTQSLPKDGNYAFICEKCADTFGYYGYFAVKNELLKRAREIYERN